MPSVDEPPRSIHSAGAFSIVNWEDEPRDESNPLPENIWPLDEGWLLEEVNGRAIPRPAPFIRFNATRTKLEGTSYCRTFYATCSFYITTFSIDTIEKSEEYCDEERGFYTALMRVTACFSDEKRLYFFAGGDEVLQFIRKPLLPYGETLRSPRAGGYSR